MEKSRLCGMTQEEVDSFLKEKNISVSVMMEHGYNKDGDWAEEIRDDKGYFVKFGDDCVRTVKMWGFSSPNGFHTFSWEDSKMTEAKAQYMTVLFHKLYEEYDVSWNSAEALALAYVMSEFEVPYVLTGRENAPPPDMSTEEGQEEVRKKLLDCIESGNVVVPDAIENTAFSEDDIKKYAAKVAKLDKEGLFTHSPKDNVTVRGEERKVSEFDGALGNEFGPT